MRKKTILRLFLLIVFSISLYSCIHDDISSSSDPSSKQYNSKSVWKEDETYIKNVMEIYTKHEAEIKKGNGTPLWDYAMTMGYMDESFLIVPVASGKNIVSCIQVARNGEEIKFVYDNEAEHIKFFQGYTTSEKRKPLAQTKSQTSPVAKPILCAVTSVSMWYPESSSPGGGYWETQYITTCTHNHGGSGCNGYYDSQGNCMPSGYEPPVYPYPGGGGGGNPQPQQPQDPCAKLKNQTANTNYKDKIDALNKPAVLNQKKETGFSESKSGVFTPLSQAASTNSSDGLTVSVSSDTKGYIHTHLNDYETGIVTENGMMEIKQPIRMFSPADVNTLMSMAEYVTNGNYSELYGTMVSSYGNYTIMFTGTASDIKTGFDGEQWRKDYVKYKEDHDSWSFEKLFLTFLKDKMNVQGVELYKIKSNGTVQKKTLNSNNKVQSSDCPQ